MSDAELPRILVVDDDADIVRLLKDSLKRTFDVVTASDGNEAFAIAQSQKLVCVLADHMMPGMTGVELLTKVAHAQPSAVRILVTASERVEDVKQAVNEARVHRYVQKPLRPIELVRLVSGAIREVELEEENKKLVVELKQKNDLLSMALAKVQAHERMLEKEVQLRTSELKKLVAELEELALRDGLTGLYNHRFFQEALATELARCARYQAITSVIFLDVDHFKNYNDLNGHPAGDALLKILGRIVADTGDMPELRFRGRLSDIAARYGGEEFAIILPETDKEGAMIRADRLRQTIAEFPFAHRELQPSGIVSVSVGVSTYPEDGVTKQDLLESADQALYAAKRAGRNQVIPAGSPTTPKASPPTTEG